jgi:holliday junction DNA helicase motor protein
LNFNYIDDVIDRIIALIEERIAVLDLINNLSNDEEWLAITKIYVLSEDVANICKDLRLSKSQLYRVRKKAIERLKTEK